MSARRLLGAEGGQAIVLIALAMAALLLGVGLAIDTGQLFVARRSAQSAADSAAWAGAVKLYRNGTASDAISAATTDAAQNGHTNGQSSTTVSVVSPPTSGEWSGDARFVQVTITRDVSTVFLQGAAAGLSRIRVAAVAGAAPTGKGYAILVLGSTGTALDVSGGAVVTVSGSDIHVNSSDDSAAIKTAGGGTLTLTSAGDSVSVVGTGVSGSGVSPAPTTGATAAFDPFAGMPEPSAVTCASYGGCSTVQASSKRVSGTETISPGIYDRGIDVTASADLTLSPGIYIMQGGGFKVAGGASVAGSGVMIFNTVTGYPTSTGTCSDMSISGGGEVSISAPTSGIYKGMLVWQDEDCGTSPSMAMTVTGATHLTALTGTFYIPNNTFSLSGASGANVSINSQIVSSQLSVSGSATIDLNYDEGFTAQPLVPALVD